MPYNAIQFSHLCGQKLICANQVEMNSDTYVYFIGSLHEKSINDKISKNERAVISIIKTDKYMTVPEIAKKLNKSTALTYRYIKHFE